MEVNWIIIHICRSDSLNWKMYFIYIYFSLLIYLDSFLPSYFAPYVFLLFLFNFYFISNLVLTLIPLFRAENALQLP